MVVFRRNQRQRQQATEGIYKEETQSPKIFALCDEGRRRQVEPGSRGVVVERRADEQRSTCSKRSPTLRKQPGVLLLLGPRLGVVATGAKPDSATDDCPPGHAQQSTTARDPPLCEAETPHSLPLPSLARCCAGLLPGNFPHLPEGPSQPPPPSSITTTQAILPASELAAQHPHATPTHAHTPSRAHHSSLLFPPHPGQHINPNLANSIILSILQFALSNDDHPCRLRSICAFTPPPGSDRLTTMIYRPRWGTPV